MGTRRSWGRRSRSCSRGRTGYSLRVGLCGWCVHSPPPPARGALMHGVHVSAQNEATHCTCIHHPNISRSQPLCAHPARQPRSALHCAQIQLGACHAQLTASTLCFIVRHRLEAFLDAQLSAVESSSNRGLAMTKLRTDAHRQVRRLQRSCPGSLAARRGGALPAAPRLHTRLAPLCDRFVCCTTIRRVHLVWSP